MRHRKDLHRLGRTSSHQRALFANLLKALIMNESIVTTTAKAKHLRRYADRMVTLAKKGTLAARREVIGELMITFNSLPPQKARAAKGGNTAPYNADRFVVNKLFSTLAPRFASRAGGYTRLVRGNRRAGDNAETCLIEYIAE